LIVGSAHRLSTWTAYLFVGLAYVCFLLSAYHAAGVATVGALVMATTRLD
jgi:hypothetical protein